MWSILALPFPGPSLSLPPAFPSPSFLLDNKGSCHLKDMKCKLGLGAKCLQQSHRKEKYMNNQKGYTEMSIRKRSFFRMFRASTNAEMMSYSCKRCRLVLLVSRPETLGDQIE